MAKPIKPSIGFLFLVIVSLSSADRLLLGFNVAREPRGARTSIQVTKDQNFVDTFDSKARYNEFIGSLSEAREAHKSIPAIDKDSKYIIGVPSDIPNQPIRSTKEARYKFIEVTKVLGIGEPDPDDPDLVIGVHKNMARNLPISSSEEAPGAHNFIGFTKVENEPIDSHGGFTVRKDPRDSRTKTHYRPVVSAHEARNYNG